MFKKPQWQTVWTQIRLLHRIWVDADCFYTYSSVMLGNYLQQTTFSNAFYSWRFKSKLSKFQPIRNRQKLHTWVSVRIWKLHWLITRLSIHIIPGDSTHWKWSQYLGIQTEDTKNIFALFFSENCQRSGSSLSLNIVNKTESRLLFSDEFIIAVDHGLHANHTSNSPLCLVSGIFICCRTTSASIKKRRNQKRRYFFFCQS